MISHGNGPQVGLLALEGAAYEKVPAYPLDVLGAETQGMIGYLVEQELGNRLPFERPAGDAAHDDRGRPRRPRVRRPDQADRSDLRPAAADALTAERGWTFKPDGDAFRRVVPSPAPKRIFELRQIPWLLEHRRVVICAGGGGIPTAYQPRAQLDGVEAVIDKDHASALLARDLEADVFVMATDADAVYVDLGTPDQRAIARGPPRRAPGARRRVRRRVDAAQGDRRLRLRPGDGRAGRHRSACRHRRDARGQAGTIVSTDVDGVEYSR